MSNLNESSSANLGGSAHAYSYVGAPTPAALAMVSGRIGSLLLGDGPASYTCQPHCSNCGMCTDCSCNCGTCRSSILAEDSNGLMASDVPFGDALHILQSI